MANIRQNLTSAYVDVKAANSLPENNSYSVQSFARRCFIYEGDTEPVDDRTSMVREGFGGVFQLDITAEKMWVRSSPGPGYLILSQIL